MVKEYKELALKEIEEFFDELEEDKLYEVADLIYNAQKNGNRLHFTGIGKPSYVAKYMSSLFSSTGTPAYFLDGTEAVHGSAGQTVENDVVIAISNSGNTNELLNSIEALKKLNLKIVGVSGNKDSNLAKMCDYHLYAGVKKEGDNLNKPPRLSIIVETLLLQLLSLILQEKHNLSKETYVMWHPGGSIGKDLSK